MASTKTVAPPTSTSTGGGAAGRSAGQAAAGGRGGARRRPRRGGGLEPFVAPLGAAPDQLDDLVHLGGVDTDQEGGVFTVQKAAGAAQASAREAGVVQGGDAAVGVLVVEDGEDQLHRG